MSAASKSAAPRIGASKPPAIQQKRSAPESGSDIDAGPRLCSACNKPILGSLTSFRWCEACRAKDRERSKAKRERKREKNEELLKALSLIRERDSQRAAEPSEIPVADAGKSRKHVNRHMDPDTSKAVSKKQSKRKEIPGGETGKRKALEWESARPAKIPRVSKSTSQADLSEFQTSHDLYDMLSGLVKSYYKACTSPSVPCVNISFQGSYSVVADPNISNSRRVRMESKYLSKIIKLPHSETGGVNDTATKTHWFQDFRCDCGRRSVDGLPHEQRKQAQPAPSTSKSSIHNVTTHSTLSSTSLSQGPRFNMLSVTHTPFPSKVAGRPLKRQQSDLSTWVLRAGTPSPAVEEQECGGRIRIISMDDVSHQSGHLFKGQKITIIVEHAQTR